MVVRAGIREHFQSRLPEVRRFPLSRQNSLLVVTISLFLGAALVGAQGSPGPMTFLIRRAN
jgi:hypothetical protein